MTNIKNDPVTCHCDTSLQLLSARDEFFNDITYDIGFLQSVPKNIRRLINNRTKAYCLIVKISLILSKGQPDLDFDTKIIEIR